MIIKVVYFHIKEILLVDQGSDKQIQLYQLDYHDELHRMDASTVGCSLAVNDNLSANWFFKIRLVS